MSSSAARGSSRRLAALGVAVAACLLAGLAAASAPAASTRDGFVTLAPNLAPRVHLPGGSFVMGSSALEMARASALCKKETFRGLCDEIAPRFRAEGLAHRVTVTAFAMDRTEVTVQAYRTCVRLGRCAPPSFSVGDDRYDRPALPVTHVRWQDAAAFCELAGGRLPTEAEWELAARGTNSRTFPWGNVQHPSICNHGSFGSIDLDDRDGHLELAEVGTLADCRTPEGIFDLAGNVAEWVSDFFDQDDDGFGHKGDPVVDPTGPDHGAFHVVKGGSYRDGMPWQRAAARTTLSAPYASDVGFRCVVPDPRPLAEASADLAPKKIP